MISPVAMALHLSATISQRPEVKVENKFSCFLSPVPIPTLFNCYKVGSIGLKRSFDAGYTIKHRCSVGITTVASYGSGTISHQAGNIGAFCNNNTNGAWLDWICYAWYCTAATFWVALHDDGLGVFTPFFVFAHAHSHKRNTVRPNVPRKFALVRHRMQ